ncbi:MAG: DUF4296 domain-containing protein [Muribaculaceae bacterium]|nr:DUF4296 domain-containing protein [Muribaculaceae bacterium]
MATVLADLHTAEVVAQNNSKVYATDSAKRELMRAVLDKHGVSSADFDSSLSWYGYNMERYVQVYDRVLEILEKRLELAEENAGTTTERAEINVVFEGDSVDVWSGVKYRRLAANMPTDFINFTLSPDRNWEHGDAYTFRGKLIANRGVAEAVMVAEYSDGTADYVDRQFHGDGWHEVTLVLDSIRSAKNVYGYLYYKPGPDEVAYIDSITLYRSRYGAHLRELRAGQKNFLLMNKPHKAENNKPIIEAQGILNAVDEPVNAADRRADDMQVISPVRPERVRVERPGKVN